MMRNRGHFHRVAIATGLDGDGLVVYKLKHPFSDDTTRALFEPVDFIARLAVLDCPAAMRRNE
jgi:hypothetical protein